MHVSLPPPLPSFLSSFLPSFLDSENTYQVPTIYEALCLVLENER